ncbi:MAG: Trp biosynthesis-associated membrane protein [Marmoricola sp.]
MSTPGQEPTRFAPVVLAGIGSTAVLAVTCARDWIKLDDNTKVGLLVPESDLRADMPLALALALVLLAAWGVVLVTGRRMRRVVLAVAALAGVGVVACLVVAPFTLPDEIRSRISGDVGRNGAPTAAYLIACLIVPVVLATVLAGLRLAPRWPEMSSRYDAPSAQHTGAAQVEEMADLEVWKALDEGRDPTGPPSP